MVCAKQLWEFLDGGFTVWQGSALVMRIVKRCGLVSYGNFADSFDARLTCPASL